MSVYDELAAGYHEAVHAADSSAVPGEPEAQLTTPVSNLFIGIVDAAKQGRMRLVRETRLDQTRPDFAALLTKDGKTRQKGYIELKAPSIPVDVTAWSGRNLKQWERMSRDAEILIICNGRKAQLYRNGKSVGEEANLPYDSAKKWDAEPLIRLIGRFLDLNPTPITSVKDLSYRLAVRTADLRDRLLWLFEQKGPASDACRGGHASWKEHVHPDASRRDFADGISQVVSYGMVLAALSVPAADADADGHLTVAEARTAIRAFSPVMAAAFAPLVDKPVLFAAVQVELGALETLISAVDPKKVNRSADSRGEPWLYFYEDFLSVYDADARRQAGVYYTPIDVVQAMVKIVDHLLVDRFEKRLGFADASVVTLDPATGTGTFPLAIIDRAAERATKVRGKAGKGQAAASLARRLYAFELLPGPYSVAHVRLSQRLQELSPGLEEPARVILTDTLESPLDPRDQFSLFGDAEVLAAEQNRAKRIKLEKKVTVVIGNPPYRRVERDIDGRGSGGWVVEGKVPGRKSSRSLFDDILDVAKANTIFSHHASLYNLYVYFWRWAIWKAFEAHGEGPGVVAFITGSSWLSGPGFVGLRALVRTSCDEAWVLDLGGDNKGADRDENIFAIETPVAVVILVRNGKKSPKTAAAIHYRRITGTASEKLEQMKEIADSNDPLGGAWIDGPSGKMESFKPPTGGADWFAMPKLADIFPWQQPGCKVGRTWPVAPDPDLLRRRWERLSSATAVDKPALFATGKTGRRVSTAVRGYQPLNQLVAGANPEPVIRYGFRSFDRQWIFQDPRLTELERPALWAVSSDKQVYFTTLMSANISEGPALTASAYVPDLHHFRGSFGGKDVIPLYRDALGKEPNLTSGLAQVIAKKANIRKPTVEDVGAYVYGLLSSPAYQQRFSDALRTPGIRMPITADAELWREAVELGRYMLWLHTYAERFVDTGGGRGKNLPEVEGIGWETEVSQMPKDRSEIEYDEEEWTLRVGDGEVTGVRPDVWNYTVSGLQVVPKWLGYRTVDGSGRATSSKSELDRIRPLEWSDDWNDELLDLLRILTLTLDRQAQTDDLLERICEGPLISVNELPVPKASEKLIPLKLPLLV